MAGLDSCVVTSIAWASGADFIAADTDLPPLLDAAAAAGHDSEVVVWDDPAVDWAVFDLVVVRSCWDYVPRRDEFLAWARRVPRLQNSAAVLTWNTDKTYLRELVAAGVDVIETRWDVRTGDDLGPHEEWVVKPAISAGSADTARWSSPEQVYAHSEALQAAGRTSMTQPYVASVDDVGETGLLFFGGEYSHAFRKGALLTRDDAARSRPELQEDITARTATPEQLAVASDVLATATRILGEQPLYARIDLVDGPRGPQLMELELAEPSFFLPHAPGSAERVVAAITRG